MKWIKTHIINSQRLLIWIKTESFVTKYKQKDWNCRSWRSQIKLEKGFEIQQFSPIWHWCSCFRWLPWENLIQRWEISEEFRYKSTNQERLIEAKAKLSLSLSVEDPRLHESDYFSKIYFPQNFFLFGIICVKNITLRVPRGNYSANRFFFKRKLFKFFLTFHLLF